MSHPKGSASMRTARKIADDVRACGGAFSDGHAAWQDVVKDACKLDAEVAALRTRLAEFEAHLEPEKFEAKYAGRRVGVILMMGISDGKPVHVLVDAVKFPHHDDQTIEEYEDGQRYFYEEHTCPTNWTRNIEVVMHNGDTDPHGFAKFVKTVRLPDECSDGRMEEILREEITGAHKAGT